MENRIDETRALIHEMSDANTEYPILGYSREDVLNLDFHRKIDFLRSLVADKDFRAEITGGNSSEVLWNDLLHRAGEIVAHEDFEQRCADQAYNLDMESQSFPDERFSNEDADEYPPEELEDPDDFDFDMDFQRGYMPDDALTSMIHKIVDMVEATPFTEWTREFLVGAPHSLKILFLREMVLMKNLLKEGSQTEEEERLWATLLAEAKDMVEEDDIEESIDEAYGTRVPAPSQDEDEDEQMDEELYEDPSIGVSADDFDGTASLKQLKKNANGWRRRPF